jgi:hypothetical protein
MILSVGAGLGNQLGGGGLARPAPKCTGLNDAVGKLWEAWNAASATLKLKLVCGRSKFCKRFFSQRGLLENEDESRDNDSNSNNNENESSLIGANLGPEPEPEAEPAPELVHVPAPENPDSVPEAVPEYESPR